MGSIMFHMDSWWFNGKIMGIDILYYSTIMGYIIYIYIYYIKLGYSPIPMDLNIISR